MKSLGMRPYICKLGGITFEDYQTNFIGENVFFDTNFPQNIVIEKNAWITLGCIILSHYIKDTSKENKKHFVSGRVTLKRNCFLGARTIITNSVTIGENSIVGAGSVVTKDIPDNEVWAGVPAKFIRKL